MTPDELPADMEARTPAPEGEAWRTVPSEPTEAMIAAANALWGEGTGVNYVQLEPEDFYAAMLAASPVVPVGSGERVRLIVSGLINGFTDFTVAEREAFIDRKTDAILAALTGEDAAGSPTSQNTEPGLAFSDAGEP